MQAQTAQWLQAIPPSERLEVLETIVFAAFRRALLMTPEEEIPVDVSFFDIGLTSLALTEVKQRLEAALDCTISANTLFNQPTIARLLEHLTGDVFGEASGAPESGTAAVDSPKPKAEQARWDEVLSDLYQR